MHMTNNILKRLCIFALCSIMCLCAAVPAMAESIEKISLGEIEYFLIEGSGDSETETPVASFSANGLYRAKVTVNNYDDTNSIGAVMITGLFNKTTHELLGVKFAKNDAIASGAAATLSADIEITDYTAQTIDSYVWKSAAALKPLGNAAPTAPADVTVDLDKVTNSTVVINWTASIDDTDSVAYYNIYRNGKKAGSVPGDETTFKDVGIQHNTEVSYTVEAVDAAGAVSAISSATEAVRTDDIARLWFGAAAAAIADGETSAVLTAEDFSKISGYNINPVHFVIGDVSANDGKAYTTSIEAVNQNYKYENAEELGISALKFNPNMSRVLASIPEGDFLTALKAKDQDEIKITMNYFDFRPTSSHTYVDSTGKNFSNMIRYGYSSQLNGTTGINSTNGQKWYTKIFTVPTSNNIQEGFVGNSSSLYVDVFKDRPFEYTDVNAAGTKTAATDGKDAMFGIGNSSGNNPVFISKIEIGMKDYVPYGAVLDFDKQEETQYVELLRRDGYNQGQLLKVTASATNEEKMAIELDNTNEKNRMLKVGFSDSYITSSDNNVILRITYLNDQTDTTDSSGLTVAYDSTSGSKVSNIVRRTGTNTWETAEFFLDDAAFSNANGSLQLGTGKDNGTDWYISRIEVIKR